ncbi:MAG: hypothetical protein RBS55_01055 [Bacteroidales bacterium]|jgi:hypothetical protein|nr:hypothetical protein [Bacteroidales bacterium]
MKKSLLILFLAYFPVMLFSQDEKSFGIKFSGFVKTDVIWDSRQTVDLREGHFLLLPKPVLNDLEGNDINAKPSFNFLSIQTRLKGDITGPDALGAKTSGSIEGEFFGMADGDINGFRLRHAFVKLNWKTTELLVGQMWHPMFITSSFPEVVSFNTGAPFLVFSRNPQIRLTKDIKSFRLILTALSQVDFKSNGPDGASTKYIRNSSIPSFNLNFEYSYKNKETGTEILAGAAGNFKRLIPRMITDSGYQTNEGINSLSGMVYLKLGFQKVIFKMAGLYGQNMFDYTMIGGYVVDDYLDKDKGIVSYRNITTASAWAEVMTTGKKMQGGLFLAYSQNMGAGDIVIGPYYSRGANIYDLYRISPRFVYNAGKFRIAPEIEYTVARYGMTNNLDGKVMDPEPVGNFRVLVGVFYFF